MQICFRPLAHCFAKRLLRRQRHRVGFALLIAAALAGTGACNAQTLARPGWVGSGLTLQTWWQHAVIYRVQPQLFEDSNGDGVGDLHGLAERLDYLQSIGVDAILLESHAMDAGFDDLLSDASRHHIRILVELGEQGSGSTATTQQEIDEARLWLRRGVAGVYLPGTLLNSIATRGSFNDAIFLLHQLRALADSFPGERIVLTQDTTAVDASSGVSGHAGPELIEGVVGTFRWDAATLRSKLAVADEPAVGEPLLGLQRLPPPPAVARHSSEEQIGREKILAALLLSSRGAIALSYGQEIGLPANEEVMQWTPTNLTRPQAANPTSTEPVIHYGAYHPYVRPARASVVGRSPGLPSAAVNTEALPPPVDPNTLPGFSTHPPAPEAGFDPAKTNVAVEDSDSDSALNFYRRVLELHSGNATLRTGSVSFLDHDGEDALVWLRRAPAGARTVASVVVVCNLGDRPTVLSLNEDLAKLHIRGGYLRPLLTSRHIDHIAQSTGRIMLSPHSVYIGELHHYPAY